jgi:hypothetical protein
MNSSAEESTIANPILIMGVLPLLPGVRSLPAGFFMGAALLIVSALLQIISSMIGRFLNPWPLKTCIVFLSSVFFALLLKAIGLFDRPAALALSEAFALAVFSGIMTLQYRGWSADIEKGRFFNASRILPVAISSLILMTFGAIRELLGSGRISLPAFSGAQAYARIFPFSKLPSLVIATSSGALLLSGYAAAAIKLVTKGKAKEERNS